MNKIKLFILVLALGSISVGCSNASKEVSTAEMTLSTETNESTELASNDEEETSMKFAIAKKNYSSEQFTNVTVLDIYDDPGCIVWTSKDPNVAQVIDGRLIYLSEGETTITGTVGDYSQEINVTVKNSILFTSPIKEFNVEEHDGFVLVVDKDVIIPEDFGATLEKYTDLVEKETGLSYVADMPENFICQDREMFTVLVTDKINTSRATDVVVYLKPDQIFPNGSDVDDLSCAAVILEELTHTIQARNSVYLGQALCEGFAMYHAISICENDLGFTNAITNQDLDQLDYMQYLFELTHDSVYKLLIDDPVDSHPFSYFFVKYLCETYGDDILNKLIDATNSKFCELQSLYFGPNSSGVLSSDDFLSVLTENIDENVLDSYVDWYQNMKAQN